MNYVRRPGFAVNPNVPKPFVPKGFAPDPTILPSVPSAGPRPVRGQTPSNLPTEANPYVQPSQGPYFQPLIPSETRPFRPSVNLQRLESGLQKLAACAWDNDAALSSLVNLMAASAWVQTMSAQQPSSSAADRNSWALASNDLQAAVRDIGQKLRSSPLSSFMPGGVAPTPRAPGQGFYTPPTAPYNPQFQPLVRSETSHAPNFSTTMLKQDAGLQALFACAWNDRDMLSSLLKLLNAQMWLLLLQSRMPQYGGTAEGINLAHAAADMQTIVQELTRRLQQL